jgi:hypothetical protein
MWRAHSTRDRRDRQDRQARSQEPEQRPQQRQRQRQRPRQMDIGAYLGKLRHVISGEKDMCFRVTAAK